LPRAVSNGLLALLASLAALGAAEALLVWTPLGDRYGWSRVPTIQERITRSGVKDPGEWRILGLGDSFAVFRESDGGNFLRIAERRARRAGFPVELVNLGQSATGLREYTRNLERHAARLRPDAVVVALYLGNDVFAYRLEALERAAPPAPPHPEPRVSWRQVLEGEISRRSAFLSLALRVARGWIPALRSGTLERSLEYLARLYGLERDEVERRLALADPGLVARARADRVNPWDVAVAVVEPRLYLDLAALDEASGHAAAAREFLAGLDRIVEIAQRSHVPIAFVLIPPSPFVGIRYHGDFARMGYTMSPSLAEGESAVVRAISDHLAARGLPHLDLTPALRASRKPVSLPEDIHFDSHGQRVAGLALAEFLEAQGLLGPGRGPSGQRVARESSPRARSK
jgi:lysophospholipase L1-like esterase